MRARVFTPNTASSLQRIDKDRALGGAPSVRFVEGGIFLPLVPSPEGTREIWCGGVVDSTANFVAGHRVHPTLDHKLNVVAAYPLPDAVSHRAEVVLYGGGGSLGHFGHFLTEGLARLWWLFENEGSKPNIVFSAPDLTLDHPSIQLLVQAGIDPERVLLLTEPTRFDTVIVPDPAFFLGSGEYYPRNATAVYDAIRDSVPAASSSRIYLTRTSFHDPVDRLRERRESMLEDMYRSQGYEIVAPETLSMTEQIGLVAGATDLASTVGTLSHWVLVANDRVRQDAILRHPTSITMDGQWGMSAMRSAELSVVTTTLDLLPGSRWAGIVTHVETPHWVQFVRERFGTEVKPADLGVLLPQHLGDWAELLASLPEDQLSFIPAWSVADFVEHFTQQLTGEPLDVETRSRLDRHYRKRGTK